ncbi:MAG: hypothetical protein NTU98_14270, partial [Bacteroidetes bacterium]|nr:hypothetical protein [Bacteroidota bacterium]
TNGCTGASSTVYPVAVNQVPAPTITGNNNLCAGTTGFIYTTQAGMNNYSWSVSGGGTITAGGTTTDNSVTITWNIPGAQSVSVNYNNANGCTATTSTVYPVTVNTVSSPTITGNNNLCVGTTGFIYSTQPGMNNYSWSVSGGGTITAGGTTIDNSVTVTWNTPGVQSVSVNYSNSYGCTAASSTVFPVTVNQVPAPTITGNNNLCVGTTGVIYSAQTGMNNYLWSVSGGGTITAGGNTTDNTVSVTWNTAGAQSVSVNYNNANGCTATTSTVYPVTVNPLPVPVITGPAALCMNSAGTYSTASGMTNYSWTVSPDGTIISGAGSSIINVMWPTNGNKTMTVNYLDVNGCASATATSFSLTVSNLPVPSLTGIDTICSGTQQIYTTDPGMTGYTWLVSSGGTVTAGGTATDHTITILWNASGTQSISVNYQAGPGCTALLPTVLDVTIKPRPSIINASNSSVCSGTSINIIPESNLPGSSFSWTATGSSGNVSGFHSGNGSSITDSLINTGFGNESVTYAVIPSMNGCDGNPSNYSVAVSPVADVYFTPAGQSLCSGGVTGIVLASHANGANFTWTASGSSGNVSGFGPGNGSSIVQNLINSGYNNETVNYDVMSAVNGCPGLAGNVLVTVSPIPAVTFTTCNDITTTTNARPILLKGGLPLSGTYSGTGVNSGIFYPSQATPGTDTIHYSYVNVYGCSNSAFITITVLSDVTFSCESNFTDVRDNTIYQTIKIGTQCWMNSNLNFGVVLPASSLQRDNCVVDKYCYNDTDSTCSTYGALYEWDELMNYTTTEGTQGLCPPSWHVPSESEWNTLFDYYISNGYAGNPLKSSGSSGFNAQLRGALFNDLNWDFNNFATFFWSSTAHGPAKAWAHAMNTNNPSVSFYPSIRTNAFPVRCLKD